MLDPRRSGIVGGVAANIITKCALAGTVTACTYVVRNIATKRTTRAKDFLTAYSIGASVALVFNIVDIASDITLLNDLLI